MEIGETTSPVVESVESSTAESLRQSYPPEEEVKEPADDQNNTNTVGSKLAADLFETSRDRPRQTRSQKRAKRLKHATTRPRETEGQIQISKEEMINPLPTLRAIIPHMLITVKLFTCVRTCGAFA